MGATVRDFFYYLINCGHPKLGIAYEDCINFKRVQDQIEYERRRYLPYNRSLLLLASIVGIVGWAVGRPSLMAIVLTAIALSTGFRLAKEYLMASDALYDDRQRMGK